jgi:RNA polymerase sigma-70 factor (ECF subfamily)
MHRHVGRLRIAAAFSAWVFAIVRRECIRLARHGFGRNTPLDGLEDDLRLSERPNHELRLDLTAAIEALPTHYRQVLMLRDIEELTIDEIAGRLEATRETIKARLHRARAFVREYLQR